jgi:CTP:molybdopterin cytidylyltransferase MocA
MIAAVILAAGASSRMGEVKALLQVDGETLLDRIARLVRAAGADPLVVAVGPPHAERITAALPAGALRAYNDDPDRGMLSSVQAALRCLAERSAAVSGALLWPVDIPFVRADTVHKLLAADRRQLAAPSYQGRGGHPLWLPAALFAETLSLAPTSSLRELRAHHPLLRVPVDDEGILWDLNTRPEFERAQRERAGRPG